MDFYTRMAVEAVAKSAEKIFAGNNGPQLPRNPLVPRVPVNIVLPADVKLDSYTKRTNDQEGTYTIIQEHREWVEAIPQPLTAEEIAASKERTRRSAQIVLGLGLTAASVAAVGIAILRYKNIPTIIPVEVTT